MTRQTNRQRYLATIQADTATLASGRLPDGRVIKPILDVLAYLDEWSGLGYPAGGGEPTRGGDATPIPERLVVAGVCDPHGDDRLEADTSIKLVADTLRWLVGLQARHTPTRRNPDARPTATCLDCGRTIADTAHDPIKAGRCTFGSAIEALDGRGCYTEWERVRKAQQRARDIAEAVERVPGVPGDV